MKDLHDRSLKREIPAILSKVKLHCGDSSVTVTSAGRVIRIYTEDILYICLAKRGCSIYVARQGEIDEMHCKESLGDLYERLAGRGFEYAHNSYIVNLAKVEGLEKNVALLQMGIQLNVSRSRKGQFADALINVSWGKERHGMIVREFFDLPSSDVSVGRSGKEHASIQKRKLLGKISHIFCRSTDNARNQPLGILSI